jgi:hypothetical protein
MARINILYSDGALEDGLLTKAKNPIRTLVAKAISAEKRTFGFQEIEWDPRRLHPEADYDNPIILEIFTSAFADRKSKLTRPFLEKLKEEIQKHIDPLRNGLTLKIRYTDEDDRTIAD